MAENYMVSLERFYGPLDLLLYLVEKDEMDIYDISIFQITEQYLAYLRQAEAVEVEKMTAFLQMATFLLQLKSRMLLPKAPAALEDGEEEPDPQAELIGRIILYKQFKQVAGFLNERQRDVIERAFYRPEPVLPLVQEAAFSAGKERLWAAFRALEERKNLYHSFTLPFQDIRIEDRIEELWQYIREARRAVRFSEAIGRQSSRREITASFLALLELMNRRKIRVEQTAVFGEIVIYPVRDFEGSTT